MLTIKAKVEGVDRTQAAFKRARKEVQGKVKTTLVDVSNRVVLPAARVPAGRFGPFLIVKATTRGAYLTGRNAKVGRIIGLLNFGGTVSGAIRPKARTTPTGRPPAVMTPMGPRLAVLGPRSYTGKNWLKPTILARLPVYEAELARAIGETFEPLEHSP